MDRFARAWYHRSRCYIALLGSRIAASGRSRRGVLSQNSPHHIRPWTDLQGRGITSRPWSSPRGCREYGVQTLCLARGLSRRGEASPPAWHSADWVLSTMPARSDSTVLSGYAARSASSVLSACMACSSCSVLSGYAARSVWPALTSRTAHSIVSVLSRFQARSIFPAHTTALARSVLTVLSLFLAHSDRPALSDNTAHSLFSVLTCSPVHSPLLAR